MTKKAALENVIRRIESLSKFQSFESILREKADDDFTIEWHLQRAKSSLAMLEATTQDGSAAETDFSVSIKAINQALDRKNQY